MTEKKYKNPAATATVVVEKDGKILLIRRKRKPHKNRLALPGGYLNCDQETLERTAQKELYEETNLRVKQRDLYLLCVNSSPKRDPRGHVIDHVYAALNTIGEARAKDDAKEVSWRDRDSLPKRLAFDHAKDVERYYEWRKRYAR